MNIFFVHQNATIAAQSLVDSHVVKMALESSQLLSTAHRILDGAEYIGKSKTGRNVKRWKLPDERENVLYSATHINHPSSVWVRQSNNNYNWLYAHLLSLLEEYTYRYDKRHKCANLVGVLMSPPRNIPITYFTPPTPAMPDEYKVGENILESYRNYYKNGKNHLHLWSKRNPPDWILE